MSATSAPIASTITSSSRDHESSGAATFCSRQRRKRYSCRSFNVDGLDDIVAHMRAHGAEVIGEMQYEDTYRLAYIRGPEGIIVALAEQLG